MFSQNHRSVFPKTWRRKYRPHATGKHSLKKTYKKKPEGEVKTMKKSKKGRLSQTKKQE